MEDFLYIRILKKRTDIRQEAFWWPLIFEAMYRAGFQFIKGKSAEPKGSYFSFHKMEEVRCTFQELWEALYFDQKQVIISFWLADLKNENFCIEISISRPDEGLWKIEITLGDSYLRGKTDEQNRACVNAFLQGGFTLFELCFPCDLHMQWDEEHNKTDLLQVRTLRENNVQEDIFFSGKILQWKEYGSFSQQHIFVVDPMPLHTYNDQYTFISLFSH